MCYGDKGLFIRFVVAVSAIIIIKLLKREDSSDLSSSCPSPASSSSSSSNCAMVKRLSSSDLSPSASRSSSSSNWSCLPKDLFELIIDKLAILSDIIRLCAVCNSWNSTALDRREKLKRLINRPWQLKIYSDPLQLQLFDLTNSEFCKFQLHYPLDEAKLCHGSSHGWLVFEKNCFQLIVLNPFFGKIIDLPPLKRNSRFSRLGKVVLSGDPSLGSFEVLVNFYNPFSMGALAHLKFGDEFWTYLEGDHELGTFKDIAFYEKWIFGASSKGRIVSLEIDHHIGCIQFKQEIVPYFSCKSVRSYFAETANGDLLIVYSVDDSHKAYSVYKLQHYSNGEFERIRVQNLGDQSLFLGLNNCISVLASNYSGCKANTIYYSYAFMEWYPRDEEDMYKVEEFNLEDQNIIEDRTKCGGIFYETPWIVLSMNF